MFKNYFENKNYIAFWVLLIKETLQKNNLKDPVLLFSAHAIPYYQIEKGDTYVDEINKTALIIANETGLSFIHC